MTEFDLIVIGGGAGAFSAVIKANSLGKKALMVNDGLPLGGTCVNVGCVPSKTLIHAAELVHNAKNHGVPGLEFEVKESDFGKVIADEQALVEKMRNKKYKDVLGELEHVSFMDGHASFIDEGSVSVGDETYTAPKIIIATGSRTRIPDIEGLEEAGYVTHIDAVGLKKLPKSLAVIGGGAQGLEWGQMFSRFGSEVTILQRGERILPKTVDSGAALRLQGILQNEGIDIITEAQVKSAKAVDGKKQVTYEVSGEEKTLLVDEILLATGRTPNTDKMDIEKSGVELSKSGAVKVSKNFETNKSHIFAVGDVADLPLRQETTAGREGTLAAANALAGENNSINYDTVPFAVFTSPQLAGVGLTEEEQMNRYNVCLCRTVQLDAVPKAGITRQTEGVFRISANPTTEVIEGMTIVAPNASELIAEVMMIVINKNTIDDVTDTIPMFPTISEGIKYAALSFKNDISKLSCCV
jgi:mercuric reductase